VKQFCKLTFLLSWNTTRNFIILKWREDVLRKQKGNWWAISIKTQRVWNSLRKDDLAIAAAGSSKNRGGKTRIADQWTDFKIRRAQRQCLEWRWWNRASSKIFGRIGGKKGEHPGSG